MAQGRRQPKEEAPPERTLMAQIEHYVDTDPTAPTAFSAFQQRLGRFHHEYPEWMNGTIIIDSVTFMELSCRKNEQYNVNRSARDPRQWWGGSTDRLEEILLMRFGSLPMTVCVICHVDRQKDDVHGSMVRLPSAPGRLTKGLGCAFSEVYHAYVGSDENGHRIHQLQCQPDNLYSAESQIGAPDTCYPDYEALWVNADDAGESRVAIHCLVYGDFGAGKSTFAATFPKPLLVFAFDPFGKERPYQRLGEVEYVNDEDLGITIERVWGPA